MTKRKERRFKPRLPLEVVDTLHKRGGSHGSRKGKRGYNRKDQSWKKQLDNSGCFLFLFCEIVL